MCIDAGCLDLSNCRKILEGTSCSTCASELDFQNEVFFEYEEVSNCPSEDGCLAIPCSRCGQFYWKGTNGKKVIFKGRYVCLRGNLIISF